MPTWYPASAAASAVAAPMPRLAPVMRMTFFISKMVLFATMSGGQTDVYSLPQTLQNDNRLALCKPVHFRMLLMEAAGALEGGARTQQFFLAKGARVKHQPNW